MKKFLLAASAIALASCTPAFALNVQAGCDVPRHLLNSRLLFVDPSKGKDTNSGLKGSPWKTIQGAKLKATDTVALLSGNYGDVHLDSLKFADFVFITAFPGNVPVFSTLTVRGSSHLIVQGMKLLSQATPDTAYTALVDVSGNDFFGKSDNVVFDENYLSSNDRVETWTQADWRAKARWIAVSVDGGNETSDYAKCVAVTNNTIRNIRIGIAASADNMLVESNSIRNYGDDGIDFAGNNLKISHNRLTDNRDLGDNNHNDAAQGQIGRGVIDANGKTLTVYKNVEIDSNVVGIGDTPNLPFPGDYQGISAFDMNWANLKVTNNIVRTTAYHGIAFYSVHGGLIANNIVLGPIAWLGVFAQSHEGTATDHVEVRNNIASSYSIEQGPSIVNMHDNLSLGMIAMVDAKGVAQFYKTPAVYPGNNRLDPNGTSVFVKYPDDLRVVGGSEAQGYGPQ